MPLARRTRGGFLAPARLLLLWLALAAALAAVAAPESVKLGYQQIMGFPVKYVTVNMNDPDVVVTTAVATRFPTGLESWSSFINRLHPDAAINGTYFCLRSYMPVGDVAVENALVFKGVVGTALCITPDNRVSMHPGPRQAKPDWTGFRTVLCAGPRLLTNGQVTVNARAEGFRDGRVLGSAPRSAVAYRADGTLILLTIEKNISLMNLACVCLHLGAVEAMALDGGNSSALYADGRSVTKPGRGLSNVLVVYSTQERYRVMADRLLPPGLPVLARLDRPGAATTVAAAPVAAPDGAVTAPILSTYASDLPAGTPARPAATAPAAVPKPPAYIRLANPNTEEPVRGTVPITIETMPDAPLSWVSLRINNQLRAMGNTWPLVFQWDSTKEPDGVHTLEVTAWSGNRTVLERDVRTVRVQNTLQVAGVE